MMTQSWNAPSVGIPVLPKVMVRLVSTIAMTAPATVVPTERMSAFTLTLEAASAADTTAFEQNLQTTFEAYEAALAELDEEADSFLALHKRFIDAYGQVVDEGDA